jgi:hypothetical protein
LNPGVGKERKKNLIRKKGKREDIADLVIKK